jgi:hypothetical protein
MVLKVARAMAHAVSRRPVTAEACVRTRGFYGGQCGTGMGFSSSTSGSSCPYHSILILIYMLLLRGHTPSKSNIFRKSKSVG